MRKQLLCGAAALLIAAPVLATIKAQAADDFYKGKNVDLYIGYSSGGGYDTYARLLARHMDRHLPGKPSIVPKNMPGAGSLVLANWLYNVAPKDGTAFGTVGRGAPFDPLLGSKKAKFDPTKFNWIGSMNDEVSVCVAWHTSGITSFEQLMDKKLVVGGTGPTADTDQFPKVLNGTLGTKFDIISGYPGGNDISLAMERGEVKGRARTGSTKGRSKSWSNSPPRSILTCRTCLSSWTLQRRRSRSRSCGSYSPVR
jgi:tripartite-type tricarboxylate transporter receptor subunit TctC